MVTDYLKFSMNWYNMRCWIFPMTSHQCEKMFWEKFCPIGDKWPNLVTLTTTFRFLDRKCDSKVSGQIMPAFMWNKLPYSEKIQEYPNWNYCSCAIISIIWSNTNFKFSQMCQVFKFNCCKVTYLSIRM